MPKMTAEQLSHVLLSTELGNDSSKINTFSYAGQGNSTYSFGVLQFDVGTNHGNVQGFLVKNGFSQDQIDQLSQHGGLDRTQVERLDRQLQAIPAETLQKFTNDQLAASVQHIQDVVRHVQKENPAIGNMIASDPKLQLALADYDNQYGISIGNSRNGMLSYLEGKPVSQPGGDQQLGNSIRLEDIQKYINRTAEAVDAPLVVSSRESRLITGLESLNLSVPDRHRGDLGSTSKPPANAKPAPHGHVSQDAVNYGGNASTMTALANRSNLVYDNSGKHSCVTQVLSECDRLKIPTFAGSTQENLADGNPGNYVRGAMTQMVNNGHWKSVDLPGARKETLNGPFGTAEIYSVSAKEYKQLVSEGKIPSGAIVYQTNHKTFNNEQTYGNDMGIAINGGKTTHNYADMGTLVEGSDSNCRVSLMVPTAPYRSNLRHALSSSEPLLIRDGDQNAAVGKLQHDLQTLGYKGSNGKPLAADNDFGGNTRFALEAFQKDHKLNADGVAGPVSLGAIESAVKSQAAAHQRTAAPAPMASAGVHGDEVKASVQKARAEPVPSSKGGVSGASAMSASDVLLSDSHSPDHRLFQQAMKCVEKIDADMGRASDQHSVNLAGQLVVSAKAGQLDRIDSVKLSEDGSRCFAVQESSPLKMFAEVSTAQAVHVSLQQSSSQASAIAGHTSQLEQGSGVMQTQQILIA
jgi:hypothetical protein